MGRGCMNYHPGAYHLMRVLEWAGKTEMYMESTQEKKKKVRYKWTVCSYTSSQAGRRDN